MILFIKILKILRIVIPIVKVLKNRQNTNCENPTMGCRRHMTRLLSQHLEPACVPQPNFDLALMLPQLLSGIFFMIWVMGLILNLINGYASANYNMTDMWLNNEQFVCNELSGYYFRKSPCPCHLNYDLWPPHWRETFCIFLVTRIPGLFFCLFGTVSY